MKIYIKNLNNQNSLAAGTIIDESHIVTVAHAFYGINIDRVEVYMGITIIDPMDPNNIMITANPRDIFIHENFDPDTAVC